jgi:hypothetical protein
MNHHRDTEITEVAQRKTEKYDTAQYQDEE